MVQLCLNNRSRKEVVLHAFAPKNLFSKNLAFCTFSRNKQLDLNISAERREKVGRKSEPKQETLSMCVAYCTTRIVVYGIPGTSS